MWGSIQQLKLGQKHTKANLQQNDLKEKNQGVAMSQSSLELNPTEILWQEN